MSKSYNKRLRLHGLGQHPCKAPGSGKACYVQLARVTGLALVTEPGVCTSALMKAILSIQRALDLVISSDLRAKSPLPLHFYREELFSMVAHRRSWSPGCYRCCIFSVRPTLCIIGLANFVCISGPKALIFLHLYSEYLASSSVRMIIKRADSGKVS